MNVNVKPANISVEIGSAKVTASTGMPIIKEYVECPTYDGTYEVTPSSEVQTMEVKDKRMTDNIIINPIPQNYGLITWNGSFLTVS